MLHNLEVLAEVLLVAEDEGDVPDTNRVGTPVLW
jgi:hypothetical protein